MTCLPPKFAVLVWLLRQHYCERTPLLLHAKKLKQTQNTACHLAKLETFKTSAYTHKVTFEKEKMVTVPSLIKPQTFSENAKFLTNLNSFGSVPKLIIGNEAWCCIFSIGKPE